MLAFVVLALAMQVGHKPPRIPQRFYAAFDEYGTRLGADESCKKLTRYVKQRAPGARHTIVVYEQKPFAGCKTH